MNELEYKFPLDFGISKHYDNLKMSMYIQKKCILKRVIAVKKYS